MNTFLQTIVFSLNDLTFTVLDLVLIAVIISSASLLVLITSRWIKNGRIFTNWDLRRKRILFQLARWVVWLVALALLLAVIGLDLGGFLNYPLVSSTNENNNFLLTPRMLFVALVVVVIIRLLLMGLERVFTSDRHFREKDSTKSKTVFRFVTYLIWVIVFLILLTQTGVNLTILWGAGAAVLVGVGFGLQQIVADLISGLFLLFEGNLREGDVVELTNGVIGKVEHIGIRTSKVLTRDDYIMIIPNTQFIIKEVINWTHNEEKTRFHIDIGVAYGSDTRLVEQVLLNVASHHKEVSRKPKPFVRFENFGDSSLDFQLFFWSKNNFRIENIKSAIRFSIDDQFRENNIQIPFPQRDVHLQNMKQSKEG